MATITSPRASSPAIPSGSNTPSSSARLSSDLPRIHAVQHDSNATTNSQPQRRNRAALRDYYNLKSKQPPSSNAVEGTNSVITSPSTSTQTLPNATSLSRTASITSTTSNSTSTTTTYAHDVPSNTLSANLNKQLDDPSFDADTYISELLQTSSLRDILRIESSLVSEIRNLDGERKALVYDNYSKLIKAVGTIGEMQRGMEKGAGGAETGLDDVKDLERRLDGLMDGLRGVTATTTSDGNENSGHEKKRGRRNSRRQRDLVKWILDAPDRLRRLDSESAVREWDTVKKLLDRWEGVDGVEDVRFACEQAMRKKRQEDGEEDDRDRKNGHGTEEEGREKHEDENDNDNDDDDDDD